MIQAIFFDFNGVIIDDERLQLEAYQNVLRGHGIELTEEEYFSSLGMDDRTFVQAAFERAGEKLSDETMLRVLQAKSEIHRKFMEDELPLFPGVVTFLKAASRYYSLGLVSMATRDEVGHLFDRVRLRPLFLVIVTSEDVNACKPAPDCYWRALEKLNGQKVNYLADLQRALKRPINGFHIFEFMKGDTLQRIVLDAAKLDEATKRVLDHYGIENDHHFLVAGQ